jgi:serine/threonine protein phosphatase PrpC
VFRYVAVSRALGDYSLKDFVISTPEVRTTELGTNDEGFLLLACDGVFDVFSNEEAVSIIQNSWAERVTATTMSAVQQSNISTLLARDLVESAIQKGSRDIVTVVVCLV